MSSIEICLTHEQLENYQHKDKNVVVIDVLRATSTINTILFSGAKSVMPVETLDECMKLRDQGYIIMAERMGKKVEGFDFGNSPTKIEKSEFEGKDVGIATSNGTTAGHLVMIASGISPGDEIITSPITFAASGNCALYLGATVKFVDIRKDTYCMDYEKLESAITKKTKAIIPVDYAGQPCDMDEINIIAKKK